MDEKSGNSSYAVDLPNGGLAFLVGNLIQQSEVTENSSIVSYGAEGMRNSSKELYLVNNTIVNNRHAGIFIKASNNAAVFAYNNIFAGAGKVSNIAIVEKNNIAIEKLNIFRDPDNFDYELNASNEAIDSGVVVDNIEDYSLIPEFEYSHPTGKRIRKIKNTIDIGALEYKGKQ
jgi:hypothetical protein